MFYKPGIVFVSMLCLLVSNKSSSIQAKKRLT